MAYVFYQPYAAGELSIIQGSHNIFTFTLSDEDGPVDLTEYIGTLPKCEFRDKAINSGGATTNCPQPVGSWPTAGVGGVIQLDITNAQLDPTTLLTKGVFSIEITHSSGKKLEVANGTWALTLQVTN